MQHRRVIKEGPIVLAAMEDGSMDPDSASSQGLFLADTRFLSRFQIWIDGTEPVLLGSSEEKLFQASFLLTNRGSDSVPARTVGILQRNSLRERSSGLADVVIEMSVVNWCMKPVAFELSIEMESDFFDSFEARGVKRLKRGQLMEPKVEKSSVELAYIGLDGVRDSTHIDVKPDMDRFEDGKAYFPISLDVNSRCTVSLELTLRSEGANKAEVAAQPEVTGKQTPDWFDDRSTVLTSDATFNNILRRSVEDIEMLLTEFSDAWAPAAGLPRFAVPFGRDSLITGIQTLSWNPALSRDALRFLADRQGKEVNPWNDEQPGKIMHEMHTGELARLREVPFGLFYGSVDATPLFLVLAAEYLRWTGDITWFRDMKPHLDAAWKWIDEYGSIDGSGYIQYQAHTPPKASSAALTVGLFNQGWKDSSTAVVYSDGKICTDHPVALSEVQGYLYRALDLWGQLFKAMPESEGLSHEGAALLKRAADLKAKFNKDFWMEDKGYFAMALDGHHRHVDSITSNPGHCLWARLIEDEYAQAVAEKLASPEVLSSWGIRTMATDEKAFNAFSYHNGSIWPFENSLIATGLKKYGFVRETQQVHEAMIDASRYFEYYRWPEVYCGVTRETAGVLARQPDASRPQAWSAGASFLLMQTWLGVAPRPFSSHVDITPVMPSHITEMVVRDMRILGTRLSLRLVKERNAVLLDIADNPGNLDIMIHPASHTQRQLVGENMPAQFR